MKLNQEQLEHLVEFLNGTSNSLYAGVELLFDCEPEEVENEMEMYEFIDSQIFECRTCGWWFEHSEEHEFNFYKCIDCGEEQNV